MVVTLKEILADAQARHYGVGMFNTINLEMARAIIGIAEQEKSPVIIGFAEAHLPYANLEDIAPIMVKFAREAKVPVAIHFDHGMTFEYIMKAIHYGFTSVMFDGSTLAYEENIKQTQEIVKIAHALNVSVEAELGHVGGAEGGGDDGHEEMYTRVDQALDFTTRTGIDALAVAIGTAHGEYKVKPVLDLNRLSEIRAAVDVPLVLHGGSGLSDEDFRNCIAKGIAKVNIFTDMSKAAVATINDKVCRPSQELQYKNREDLIEQVVRAVVEQLQPHGGYCNRTISYPELINYTIDGIKAEVGGKMRLFGSSGKA